MYKGSCLCGTVAYEVRGELGPVIFCHCKRCRKATGSAFNTGVPVKTADFHLTAGEKSLGHFEHSSGLDRAFCRECGSPIYSRRKSMPELTRIRLGTLDTPVSAKVSQHIYTASKAEWFDILDHAPQYPDKP